jgi:hypothetical protein
MDQYLTREPPELVSPVTSHATPTFGDNQPPHPGHHWPITSEYVQSHHSDVVSWNNPLTSRAASEASAVLPTLSSGKYFFPVETISNPALTDHGQACLATGGKIKAGNPPARSIR